VAGPPREERVGTSARATTPATLELTGRQEELVRAVVAAGKPTVVVLVNRPAARHALDRRERARDRRGWIRAKRAGRRSPR